MRLIMKHRDETRSLDIMAMPIADAIACEQYTDMPWTDWRAAVLDDRALAIQFAWWLAGRREGVTEKFSSIDLDLAQMEWSSELTDEEKADVKGVRDEADPDESKSDDRPTGPAETPAG